MLRHLIMLFISGLCVGSELLNLEIGSPCIRNEVPGQCVNIHDCLSSYLDFQEKDYPPICSFQGNEPVICCTDCELNNTRNIFINPNLGILVKTGRKAEDKCKEYYHRLDYFCKKGRQALMVRKYRAKENCNDIFFNHYAASYGGVDAFRQQYPHMALLGYGVNSKTADWLCGGSVISERFILTAGHCLSSPTVGPVNFIALGILKRTDPQELWNIYNVKRRIPHPEYRPPSKYHDIALLETDTEISFSSNVLPICLHSTGEASKYLAAIGWGALGYKKALADNLQSLSVEAFKEDECSKLYPSHRHMLNGYNHTTQMCYGDKNAPRDTCEGDSGGPLQSTELCMYVVAGVTSHGRQCGVAGVAGSGIYTRVIHYVPWIESVVWP
ncbi:hypothetical protein PYW07_004695 [Mythimna separata]|uniref:Serine protease snake-like n=1 Tax=Mythimna separata TaxID=271217 RepID=A0AAD8DYC7_MYTSE|nr:hypothetical protein PYW07_004695 [Mythimna separata]